MKELKSVKVPGRSIALLSSAVILVIKSFMRLCKVDSAFMDLFKNSASISRRACSSFCRNLSSTKSLTLCVCAILVLHDRPTWSPVIQGNAKNWIKISTCLSSRQISLTHGIQRSSLSLLNNASSDFFRDRPLYRFIFRTSSVPGNRLRLLLPLVWK